MRKVHLVCSLLLTLGASMFGMGCDGGKQPDPKKAVDSAPKMGGPAPIVSESPKKDDAKAETGKKLTARKPKPAGVGSTTGGGVEVPAAPAGGATEKPAEATPEAKPEPKADETKPEDKPAEKAEEKKPE